MKDELFVLLFQPGEFFAPRSIAVHPEIIMKCDITHSKYGDNALFHSSDDLIVDDIITRDKSLSVDKLSYQFHYFNKQNREQKKHSEIVFNKVFHDIGSPFSFNQLMPAVAIRVNKDKQLAYLYHFNDTGYHGSIMLKYSEIEYDKQESLTDWLLNLFLIDESFPRLTKYRHLLNDTCWYTRWKHDMELERKYTFKGIPDTWALNIDLYKLVNVENKLAGYVPEIDMDFQVFDYDNHLFEVIEPSAKGYISFIPQTNGKTVIKQKWFEKNAELRKESITYDVDLNISEFDKEASKLAGGKVKKLAPFRRKRFDINFESLDTGNIFGVYFDICRSLEEPEKYAFSQCEVEYCRSRTMFDYKNVILEFESVCLFVKNFLENKNIEFEHNLFSKLDFSRETFESMNKGGIK